MYMHYNNKSLISALCSSIANVPLNLAEWNYQLFIDKVSPSILTTADLIHKHSVILKPLGDAIQEVFFVLRRVKFNHLQSAVIVARLLHLTKVIFSPFEKIPNLSSSVAIFDTIDSFLVLTNRMTTYISQYNDSKWYEKMFCPDGFKREFEQINKLLENFSSEHNLKFSVLPSTSIEGFVAHDEEAFNSALITYNQSFLDRMSDQYSYLSKQLDSVKDSSLKEELETQMMSCLKNKKEKENEMVQLEDSCVSLEITLNDDDIDLDWTSKVYYDQAEVVYGQHGLANIAIKFYKDDDYISAELDDEYRILQSLPSVPSVPSVYGIAQVYEGVKSRMGLVMERLSSFTLKDQVEQIQNDDQNDDQKLEVLITLAKTLAKCHECHFLHGDLKPYNILFRDKVPVLIGWGNGKNTSSKQVSGERTYSDKIDVFAFGLIMVFVFTGQSILQDLDEGNHQHQIIIDKLTSGNIPSIPPHQGLPLSLYPLLSHCLEFEIAQRPSMSEVWTVLTAYKKKTRVVDCLTYDNMPLCRYAFALLDTEYVTSSEAKAREELYQNLLDLLSQCYDKELGTNCSVILDLIEQTDTFPADLIQKRSHYNALFIQRTSAFDGVLASIVDVPSPSTVLPGTTDSHSLERTVKEHDDLKRRATSKEEIFNDIKSIVEWDNLNQVVIKSLEDLVKGNITALDLNFKRIGNEGVSAVARALDYNHTASSLYLRCNNIGKGAACALARALETNQTLINLDLQGNNIGDEGACALARALESNATLSTLNLWSNNIGKEGASAVARALESNATLASLNLSNNNIGREGACALARAVESNATLSTLNLWSNNIGKEGASAVARALESNATLASLNLSNNNIGREGACALARALESNATLSTLNLWSNNIGKEGASAVARALESNATLASLNLGINNIGSGGACALAHALEYNQALSSLDLGCNMIGNEGACALAHALQSNQALSSLDLSSNHIGKEGAFALGSALDSEETHFSLILVNNNIGFISKMKLKKIAFKRSFLKISCF
ncbi:hypothetical protein P9112_000490 [Eukaryota sp. TZLM1-RC]